MLAAVEFADNSPEPPLDSLYDHLYVLGDQVPGWYGVDERSPDSRAADRSVLPASARQLAESGAAYAEDEELREAEGDQPDTRPDHPPWRLHAHACLQKRLISWCRASRGFHTTAAMTSSRRRF